MYIDKYWGDYIGGTDDSLLLLDYLIDKQKTEISLREIFEEIGLDKMKWDFRKTENNFLQPFIGRGLRCCEGVEYDFHFAIDVVTDLAALMLECSVNGTVSLGEVWSSWGSEWDEEYEAIVRITFTEEEKNAIGRALADFVKDPLAYDLHEFVPDEDMYKMALVCENIRKDLCEGVKKPKIQKEKIMSLFGKKKLKDSIPVTIDLCDDYFVINGKQFTIPARVSELIDILGEPRCVADRHKDTEIYKEIVYERYHLSPEKFSEMDYYWDDLGLMASTHERKTVYFFYVKLGNMKKYLMDTAENFPGTLLINSRPWQEVVEETGGNSHTFHMKLGKLFADVIRSGTKAKDVKQFQIGLNKGEEFQYFDD